MKKINIDNFTITTKCLATDDNQEVVFYSQPDFAYKKRLHIYNSNNEEVGYVQYKILSIQNCNELFDASDRKIDVDDIEVVYETNDILVKENGEVIMNIINNDNQISVDIKEIEDKYILLLYSLIQGE